MGIVGPNGAGKSTLLKVICNLIKPSTGQIILNEIRSINIATILEDQQFLSHLSGEKNLNIFSESLCNRRIDSEKGFRKYGLYDSKNLKYKFYSSGMKKRMDLMSVFCEENKFLYLLDEPTNALDIDSLITFSKQILTLKSRGRAFIISSHHVMELEKVCDQFLFMDKGVVLTKLNKHEILQNFGSLEKAYLFYQDNRQGLETRNQA